MEWKKLRIVLWLRIASFTLLIFFSSCQSSVTEERVNKPPNVLMILVDDMRPAIGAYGDSLAITPNIDAFAQESITFQNAYTQQAVCAPSRNTLMTGIRPDGLGIHDLRTFFRTKAPNIATLSQHFKNNGYHAEGMGKIYHEGHGNQNDTLSWTVDHWTPWDLMKKREPVQQGDTVDLHRDVARVEGSKVAWYEYPLPENMHHDAMVANRAVDRLETLKHNPFFLAVGFRRPHLPFNAPKKYWDMYSHHTFRIPLKNRVKGAPDYAFANWGELRKYHLMPDTGYVSDEYAKKLIHGYYACVSFIDVQIGKLITQLKNLGLYENTIIVLWGDHGYKLGEYGEWCKHTNFELDTRIPLMVRAPGLDTYGTAGKSLVETVDIYPTLCELAGLQLPDHLQGSSFLNVLKDPSVFTNEVAFSQYPRSIKREEGKQRTMGTSMRTPEWRYTRWIDRKTNEMISEELYDHRSSREEMVNLAQKPEFAQIMEEMRNEFDARYKQVHNLPQSRNR